MNTPQSGNPELAKTVFQQVVNDLGTGAVAELMELAKQAIREGDSGVLVTDGDEDGAVNVTLGIGEEFVDFSHVKDTTHGMYAMPLEQAAFVLSQMQGEQQ